MNRILIQRSLINDVQAMPDVSVRLNGFGGRRECIVMTGSGATNHVVTF
jgi:hypothetical protein